MSNSITGTRDNSFSSWNPSQVNVTWQKTGSSAIQLIGFAQEDDAIQIEQDNDLITYTKGLYGHTTANISLNNMGTVTLKFLGSSPENSRFATWYNEAISGYIRPADIIVSGVAFRNRALKCLPTRLPVFPASSVSDPSITWVLKAAEIELAIPIQIGPVATIV